jgi:hypothetical protein
MEGSFKFKGLSVKQDLVEFGAYRHIQAFSKELRS